MDGSPSSVLTLGLGAWGGPGLLLTLGLGIAEEEPEIPVEEWTMSARFDEWEMPR